MSWQRSDLALNGGNPCLRVPFRWPVHDETEKRLLFDVLESGRWGFSGPREAELAAALASYLRVPHALLVSSGTVALEVAVQALNIGPGDEVIMPALTWTAPARAIAITGASPVFADISPENWCISPDAVEQAITSRTRALLIVHTYSHMCDLERILAIANANGLRVIEDCAHALGSEWLDQPAGTFGDVGCFSFQLSKAITAGEGGLVITSDRAIADRLHGLKNCGRQRTPESDSGFGGNYRMTDFQAAILLAQLSRLDDQVERKIQNIKIFEQEIASVPGVFPLPLDGRITRRSLFGLSLRVDRSCFANVSTRLLVTALAAEGVPVFMPHQPVYQSPMWVSGLRERFFEDSDGPRRLGLDGKCPRAESIASQEGVVIAHEAFLGSAADVGGIVEAFRKVRLLARHIPADAKDLRSI